MESLLSPTSKRTLISDFFQDSHLETFFALVGKDLNNILRKRSFWMSCCCLLVVDSCLCVKAHLDLKETPIYLFSTEKISLSAGILGAVLWIRGTQVWQRSVIFSKEYWWEKKGEQEWCLWENRARREILAEPGSQDGGDRKENSRSDESKTSS